MKNRHDEIAALKRIECYSKSWFTKALELLKRTGIDFEDVIDIGAGKGEFLELLQEKYCGLRLSALDYIDINLQTLKSKGMSVISLDLDDFELAEVDYLRNKFDLVSCLAVVEHIFDLDRLFRLFSILLRNGGYLLISTPNMASWPAKLFYLLRGYPYNENHHVRFLTRRRMEQYTFFNSFNIIQFNDYFTPDAGIIKKAFGFRNKYLVYILTAVILGPCWLFSKLGIFEAISKTDIVLLAQKGELPPLGIENFQVNYNNLNEDIRTKWKGRIKEYLKKDRMKETIYFESHLKNILADTRCIRET